MKDILLVDGYNIIGAWDELKRLKDTDIGQARDLLIDYMAEYQATTGRQVIIVFDAYEVKGIESKSKQFDVEVIYTKEKETADECIERLIKKIKNIKTQVYVATSDYAEQRIVFGQGALRKSARELYLEMQSIENNIKYEVEITEKKKPPSKIEFEKEVFDKLEKMRRGEI